MIPDEAAEDDSILNKQASGLEEYYARQTAMQFALQATGGMFIQPTMLIDNAKLIEAYLIGTNTKNT